MREKNLVWLKRGEAARREKEMGAWWDT